MESVLIDQSPMNPRKSVVVNSSSSNGGFMTRSHKSFSSSSYPSVSRLFPNLNARTGSTASIGLFGSRPPPPRHSSLPSFSAAPSVVASPRPFPAPSPPVHQAPLLPLPISKPVTLPSPAPTKRIAAVAAAVTTVRSRDHRKKTRPVANPPRKEARSPPTTATPSDPLKGESVSVVPQKPDKKPAAPPGAAGWEGDVAEGEEEREEGFSMESVYLLSPPPSSLPLPTFFLKRPKAAASATSCIAEAMGCGGGGGGGASSGATDDLRRLLRL